MPAAYDLLALGAAACWALGSLISVGPSRHLGAFAFSRWRMLLVALMLWAATLTLSPWGGWHSLPAQSWWPLALI